MPDSDESPDLKHFLHLFHDAGALDEAADSSHLAAVAIALTVLDEVQFIDDSALRGLCHFIGIAKVSPDRARRLLEGQP